MAEVVVPDDGHATARFRALLHGAAQAGAAAAVGAALRTASVAEGGVALAVWVVARAHTPFAVNDLAAALGVSRRTLQARCAAAGLPAPGEVVAWGRLLAAAHLLDRPDASVDRVAAALGCPSANALRNQFARYLGTSPTALRARDGGAFPAVVAGFVAQCRAGDSAPGAGPGCPAPGRPGRRLTDTVACALTFTPTELVEMLVALGTWVR